VWISAVLRTDDDDGAGGVPPIAVVDTRARRVDRRLRTEKRISRLPRGTAADDRRRAERGDARSQSHPRGHKS
jgi:hypothetical protein